MSIEISRTTETIDLETVIDERTFKTVINTEKGTDYSLDVFREQTTTHNGNVVSNNRDIDVTGLHFPMSEMLADTSDFVYKDILGNDKTIPVKDIPVLIPQYIEKLVAEMKIFIASQDGLGEE